MASSKWSKVEPYNPLSKQNLAENIADRLLRSEISTLPPHPFLGAGVYAIYYFGQDSPYTELGAANKAGKNLPIYVGKAVPPGTRKGAGILGTSHGPELFSRLREHADSITAAKNLDLADFRCRFLVLDEIWIPLAEAMLIEKLRPVWNLKLDGFGNHDPGKGRSGQKRSLWDTLHPGRKWAARLKDNGRTAQQLGNQCASFLIEELRKH